MAGNERQASWHHFSADIIETVWVLGGTRLGSIDGILHEEGGGRGSNEQMMFRGRDALREVTRRKGNLHGDDAWIVGRCDTA